MLLSNIGMDRNLVYLNTTGTYLNGKESATDIGTGHLHTVSKLPPFERPFGGQRDAGDFLSPSLIHRSGGLGRTTAGSFVVQVALEATLAPSLGHEDEIETAHDEGQGKRPDAHERQEDGLLYSSHLVRREWELSRKVTRGWLVGDVVVVLTVRKGRLLW